MKRIYLLRHTESEKNLMVDFGDIKTPFALTKKGQNHAIELARHIQEILPSKEPIDIYNSSSSRASETARIIANELKVNQNTISLTSVNSGEFRGKKHAEQELIFPEFYKKEKRYCNNLLSGFELAYPGGESMIDFQNRIITKFEHIINSSDTKNILVVCHQSVIGAILNKYKKMKKFEYEFLHTDLGHFARLELKENKIKLLSYNNSDLLIT